MSTENIDKLTRNRGVIIEPPKPEDFVAGGISGVEYLVKNLTGDWSDYLPTSERQSNEVVDYFNCVTQSGHNALETQLNQMIKTGEVPQGLQNWLKQMGYIDEEGHANFNDAFSAKLCGTTKRGATFQKFWDSVRHNGLIPEKDWHKTSDNMSWDNYYADIPEALLIKGREFLKWFEIQYEWVRALTGIGEPIGFSPIDRELKHAPLQIATATCSPWSYGVIPACNASVSHATMIYNLDNLKRWIEILDTYVPFTKQLDDKYLVPYIMKGILKVKTYEVTTAQAAYIYCLRPDVAEAFPASNKFVSLQDPNYTIYDWCHQFGVYELPEVFVDKKLDYSKIGKERIDEAAQLDPDIKKNENWLSTILKNIINFIKDFLK